MKIEYQLYHLEKGEWKVALRSYETLSMSNMYTRISKWYKNHPYAKRIDKEWICGDYRIDQQRPQRNVRSDGYIKIIEITEKEENHLTDVIKMLESKIDYPTTWDDGEHRHYEETIYCPKCGKRRKVLTSKTHCEFCGFEFNKAKKCPKCNSLNLKGSNYCIKCNYEFRKKSFINDKEFEVKKKEKNDIVKCPICNKNKSKYFDTCQNCGFDFTKNKQCPKCKKWINGEDKYCGYCGQKQMTFIKCKNCGKKNKISNNYCNYCGNKLEI